MATDLFAGIPVSDLERAVDWYTRLLGAAPSFRPNDTEAVWEVTEHGYLYVELLPDKAGRALVTVFLDDLAQRVTQVRERGIEPAQREVYDNGVGKVTYRDADGNEVGLGGLVRSAG